MRCFCWLLLFCLVGCVPVGEVSKPVPVVQSVTVWDAVADRIKAGKIETTDEVLLIVRELVQNGDLSGDEAAKVDRLGWEKSRKIQPGDESSVRGLK